MTTLRTIQDAFINLQYRGFTIASYLAQHKKMDALDKILDLGAKVEDAIYGAALASDVEQVNKYLGSDPAPSYICSAIRGYARAGNFDAILELPDYKKYLKERVLGASQGGASKQIESWLIKDYSLLSSVVEGSVDADNTATLMNILKGTVYYPHAIYHAARSGSTALVEELLDVCGVKEDSESSAHLSALEREAQLSARSFLNQAANGFVAGGHYKEAALMLERGADCSLCLSEIAKDRLEPFLALYCSIQNEEIATNLLEQMQLRLRVNGKKIPSEMLKEAQGIKELMSSEKINYLAAKNKIELNSADPLLEEKNITLPFLLKVLSRELEFNLDFDVQHEMEHTKSSFTV
ncbi:MAG: hypothetical protein P4L79_01945 [Legionella sp.]|uniref:hypothetical protein n=1 Tax=Legionella sp. TaxID=459 RepID=UPI0028488592|nr:hypothetical protein [Legionella sp.]